MKCFVYRSLSRPGAWLYSAEPLARAKLPGDLRTLLGRTREVMSFDTATVGRLVQVDPEVLIRELTAKGYHLCLRDPDEVEKMLRKRFSSPK